MSDEELRAIERDCRAGLRPMGDALHGEARTFGSHAVRELCLELVESLPPVASGEVASGESAGQPWAPEADRHPPG